ncbi:hypothetical protein ABFT80_06130 [Mesorhizobium sp. SB112]
MKSIKVVLVLAAAVVALGIGILFIFSQSASNAKATHAGCEMLIIEKQIEANRERDYRRACMRSRGYSMLLSCHIGGHTSPSCFTPTWIFWVDSL